MKKFIIEFYGSRVYPQYTGVVACIEIQAIDFYVASEIANKLIDKRTAYYTDDFIVSEVKNK